MFNQEYNDDKGIDDKTETDDNEELSSSGLEEFGLFSYAMRYCQISNTPLSQCFDEQALLVFSAICWQIKSDEIQNKRIKQMRRK